MKGIYMRLLFVLIVVALLVVSLITYSNLNNYMEEVMLIQQSNKIIRTSQSVLSTVKDAETGHRGFQLTHDTLYLEPYYAALIALPTQLNTLDSLVTGNAVQEKNIDSLRTLAQNQFSIISNILSNTKHNSLFMGTYENSLLAQGKTNMDLIRTATKHIVEEEEKLVNIRINEEGEYKNIAPIALLFYTLFALFGVTFLFVKNLQTLKKREAAENLVKENFKNLQLQTALTEERKIILNEAESLANMGSWKWTESTDELVWSEGLYKIFDKNLEEIVSWNTFLENVFLEDKLLLADFLNEVKTKKSGSAIEYRIIHDSQIRYLALTVKPHTILNIDILGAVVDITERKEYEKQLEQNNEELKRSNEDLEQFAYVASHDLQEPLRKIVAFGDRLVSNYQTTLDDQGMDYLKRMQSAASRMQTLIQDLLSFSRVSRVEVKYELLAPKLLLKEVLEDIDSRVEHEEASIEIGMMPSFSGDRSQLKRLFQNLITNAIKFHKPDVKPVVKIQGKVMKESEIFSELGISLPNAEYVRISIADNGIGFNEKYVEKIFTIFQRLHGRTAYEGTGIGLSICRKIVANHNGYIIAKSSENIGSEFIVIFKRNLNAVK